MNRLQPVATFTELNPEAIAHVVEHGIIKIPQFLGKYTMSFLKIAVGREEELTAWEPSFMDDIAELHDPRILLATPANLEKGMEVAISSRHVLPVAGREPSHIDDIAPRGISMLMPYDGPEAVFGASNTPFTLCSDTFKEHQQSRFISFQPEYITTYGPGDAIVIRQPIKRFNGQLVDLDAMRHAAGSSGRRKLLLVDFLADDLEVA